MDRQDVDVLEVGLGTGLNMLLTWLQVVEGKCRVRYTALEPHPLPRPLLQAVDHCAQCGVPTLTDAWLDAMTAAPGALTEGLGAFRFTWRQAGVEALTDTAAFDVVYFDAFAPRKQPELWTAEVFTRLFRALRPGGVLVTYSAKGEVRRTLEAVGFRVRSSPARPANGRCCAATSPTEPCSASRSVFMVCWCMTGMCSWRTS
ncbi:MAG: SAM-dependent methyltransferase [Flavobacteriales bacterium]|nr:SAM-dependent methyltransferase [Flavobacteriales bacterium]